MYHVAQHNLLGPDIFTQWPLILGQQSVGHWDMATWLHCGRHKRWRKYEWLQQQEYSWKWISSKKSCIFIATKVSQYSKHSITLTLKVKIDSTLTSNSTNKELDRILYKPYITWTQRWKQFESLVLLVHLSIYQCFIILREYVEPSLRVTIMWLWEIWSLCDGGRKTVPTIDHDPTWARLVTVIS